ncbi:MAG: alpha/beta fold hydrolase [Hyphomonadaceae bacterium]
MSVVESVLAEEAFRRVSFPFEHGAMAGIAFGDASRPPDIVFLHGTGFNARTYRRMLAPLGERYHVLALDLRGHGLTTLPPKTWGYNSWHRHRDDVITVLDKHLGAPVTLAGHSMGATTALLIAGKRPDLVRALAMTDPVFFSESAYRMMEFPFLNDWIVKAGPIPHGVARRRAHFASREEAVASLTGRGIFKTFPADVLADYVADGMLDDPHGGVRLACAPAFESQTYKAQRHDPWRALAMYEGPIVLLRGEIGSTCAPSITRRIKERHPGIRLATVEGSTHALPMERPDRVRAAIEAAALMSPGGRFRDLI